MPTKFPHWEFVSDIEKLIDLTRRAKMAELEAGLYPSGSAQAERADKLKKEEAAAKEAFCQKWAPIE